MVATKQPGIVVPVEDDSFPTAAIVVLAIGGYLVLFVICLVIRQCIINKGNNCCPVWCSELCQCQTCCNDNQEDGGCIRCAQACDWKIPSKKSCMDTCCPTKQWCDETFCFMFSKQPEGQCCKCDDNCCSCGECGDCCDCKDLCPDFNDCCSDCKCECCAQPETIDCCCIEIKLAGNRDQSQQGASGMMQGGHMNQGGWNQGYPGGPVQYPGGPIMQQPGYMQQMSMMSQPGASFNSGHPGSFQPGSSGVFYPGQLNQSTVGFNQPSARSNTMSRMNSQSGSNPTGSAGGGGGGMFQARSANQGV